MKKRVGSVIVVAAGLILLLFVGKGVTENTMTHGSGLDYSSESLWAYRPQVYENEVDVFFVAPTATGGEEYTMDLKDQKNLDNFLGACFTDYSGSIVEETPNLCGAYLDTERGTLKVMDVTPEQNVQDRIDCYLN